jgi:hypothetical protein
MNESYKEVLANNKKDPRKTQKSNPVQNLLCDEIPMTATCDLLPGTKPLGRREVCRAGRDLLQRPPPRRLQMCWQSSD